MNHEYKILEQMLIEGKISRQEFKERIDAEYNKLEQEPQSFGPPELHEHI